MKKCVAAENLVTKRVIASFEMCALVPIKLDLIIRDAVIYVLAEFVP